MHKNLVLAAVCWSMWSAMAQTAPYAGQQSRTIKALPDTEVAELLAGQGMGLAKAAELNGYPGPAHVLEHADALRLSPQQRLSTQALMDGHKARARRLGAAVVDAERALDQVFASRQIDAASLSRLTATIGERQAQLREEHLRIHLEQTALLSEEQVARYAQLRGYRAGGADASSSHRKHH